MSTLSTQDKDLWCIQCYLCRHCRYETHPHIPAHNFLNIQRILNPQKVLESWDSGHFNHTIFTIHVDTFNTRQGSLMHSMLPMSTLSIQFSHLTFTLYKVLCKCRHCQQTWHSVHCMLWSSYRQCRQTRYPTQYTIALLWSFVSTISTCPIQ